MEERDQTDNYQRYFVKNNILYKSYYGNGAIAIDAPGGITDLTFCKEMDQVYDVYGESWLNLLSKVQRISVEEGNTTFSVVGDYLCRKVYMPGYTGENEWDPYQLKLVMAKPFTGIRCLYSRLCLKVSVQIIHFWVFLSVVIFMTKTLTSKNLSLEKMS